MVDYRKWDNLDSDSDSDSGSATAAAANRKLASNPAAADDKRVLDKAEVLRYQCAYNVCLAVCTSVLPMIQSGVEWRDAFRLLRVVYM